MNHYYELVSERIAVGLAIDAFQDRWSQLCVEKWQRGVRDRLLAETILSRVCTRQAKIRSGQVIPFRQARFPHGEVFLGWDLASSWHFNGQIWLPKFLFSTPWLVCARTGHGKSVLEADLALGLARTGTKTWQLSFWKDDLLGQLPRFQQEGLELVVLRPEDLKLNPLHAGRNDPLTHLTATTSRLARHLRDLPPRADLLLRGICHEVYSEFGVFNGQNQTRFPSLFRVYEKLRTRKGLNIPARDALLDRLGSFLERLTPRCSAWLQAWDPTDLAQHSLVLLCRKAGEDVKNFLLEWLIDHVFQHQVERGVVNGDLQLFIFVDDAQTLVNCDGSTTISGLDQQVGRNRGAGISIAFFTQTDYGVSRHLLSNINGLFLGSARDYTARLALGGSTATTSAQLEWIPHNLQRGCFVGSFAEGDWHEPFVFKTGNVNLAHTVTEADILRSQEPLASLPLILDDDFVHWERHPLLELQPTAASSPGLSPAELRLLNLVVAEPGKAAGYYTRKLRMNGRVARAARERLLQLVLLRQHKVQLNRRGKPGLVLEPTPAAQDYTATPTEGV